VTTHKTRINALRVTQRLQYEAHNLLFGEPVRAESKYDPLIHPAALLEYFGAPFKALEEGSRNERFFDKHGRVAFSRMPVDPPTVAGFAAKMGTCRETIWSWGKIYTEFGQALAVAKSMQEHLIVALGSTGAYDPRFASMMMKNYGDWQDKIEQNLRGSVTLHFDLEDQRA